MRQEELNEVLRKHKMWLDGEEGGERADLSGSDLRAADLRDADLSDADLSGSNLSGADLRGSNLRGSNLSGADLGGSRLSGAISDRVRIKTIMGLKYHINIWDDMMSIGCQQHKIEEWFEFSDDRIAKMDRGALEWWSAKKDLIRQLAIEFGAIK